MAERVSLPPSSERMTDWKADPENCLSVLERRRRVVSSSTPVSVRLWLRCIRFSGIIIFKLYLLTSSRQNKQIIEHYQLAQKYADVNNIGRTFALFMTCSSVPPPTPPFLPLSYAPRLNSAIFFSGVSCPLLCTFKLDAVHPPPCLSHLLTHPLLSAIAVDCLPASLLFHPNRIASLALRPR